MRLTGEVTKPAFNRQRYFPKGECIHL
jgi:hypothetical protein